MAADEYIYQSQPIYIVIHIAARHNRAGHRIARELPLYTAVTKEARSISSILMDPAIAHLAPRWTPHLAGRHVKPALLRFGDTATISRGPETTSAGRENILGRPMLFRGI